MTQRLMLIPVLGFAVAIGACDVDQTREGELPEVEVVDEGQSPAFDVDPADVDVTTDTQTVVVPDIDVGQRRDTTVR